MTKKENSLSLFPSYKMKILLKILTVVSNFPLSKIGATFFHGEISILTKNGNYQSLSRKNQGEIIVFDMVKCMTHFITAINFYFDHLIKQIKKLLGFLTVLQ